jgi:hypothetical protein
MAKLVPENHPALHTIAEELTAEDFDSGAVAKIVKGLRAAIKTYDVDGYAAVAIAAPQIGGADEQMGNFGRIGGVFADRSDMRRRDETCGGLCK